MNTSRQAGRGSALARSSDVLITWPVGIVFTAAAAAAAAAARHHYGRQRGSTSPFPALTQGLVHMRERHD